MAAADKPHAQDGEDVLALAKTVIGEVTGDEARAAEGRAEQERAQRGQTLKEAVDRAIVDTSGSERTRR
jgi:uncharacterized protein YjbJ (UPF0337 family)